MLKICSIMQSKATNLTRFHWRLPSITLSLYTGSVLILDLLIQVTDCLIGNGMFIYQIIDPNANKKELILVTSKG